MKNPKIQKIEKDLSIPWFEIIKKSVIFPGSSGPEIFYSIKPLDYVTVFAQTEEKKVILLKQYRPVVGGYTIELPSGHVEKGEKPAEAIARELKEETNYTGRPVLLGQMIPDTGRLENRLWAFYAEVKKIRNHPDLYKKEDIEVFLVSLEELFEMIADGRFNHALNLSVVALTLVKKLIKYPRGK